VPAACCTARRLDACTSPPELVSPSSLLSCRVVVVESKKEIAQRIAPAVGDLALCKMMRPIMQHVTPLAEAFEVGQPVVRRIIIKMRGSEHDASAAALWRFQ
jgi:hypothetical protein